MTTGGVDEDTALTLVIHEVMSHYWKEDRDELETESVNARASFLKLGTVEVGSVFVVGALLSSTPVSYPHGCQEHPPSELEPNVLGVCGGGPVP